ncbi:diphthamide synthesis protein [Candidatus Woesearchaeota archaeon]|nr:diphthamide synthesis protein [Candidatus Woesearchaeota archaeon]
MYDLELSRVVKGINKQKVRTVCIQLPDGLKPKAKEIADRIEKETKARCLIWAGSCFGACDVPEIKGKADMLIQWGHSEFGK